MNTTINMHNVAKITCVDQPFSEPTLGDWLCRQVVITDRDGNAITIHCHMSNETADEADAADALASYEDDLPQHKRAEYAERMYEAADDARKAQRENAP